MDTTPTAVRMTGRLDPRSGWEASGCTIAKTLDLLSTRTSFLLLREAFYGTDRFDDFATRVGISPPVCAARLKELVADGLLAREDYQEPGQRTRQAYVLTEKGAALLPVLVALMDWGNRYEDDHGGPVELRHHGRCDQPVHAELRCAAGHRVDLGHLDLAERGRRGRRPPT
jgi:DNA-binding HxlR family transcriptional regulator